MHGNLLEKKMLRVAGSEQRMGLSVLFLQQEGVKL